MIGPPAEFSDAQSNDSIDFRKLEELMPLPYCFRCKKSADHFEILYSDFSFAMKEGIAINRKVGEIVVKIHCHGMEYQFSNIRGFIGDEDDHG